VSRRKGQVYPTAVYDLERRVVLWVGDGRTEDAVQTYFTEELGTRRCRTLQIVCMDMWAAYANLVRQYAPQARILFAASTLCNTSTRLWIRCAVARCAG
jgi:transposase